MPSLTVLCDQRTHCATCRATGGDGPAWRAAILAHYRVPEGWPVAGCPRDLPMGWVPTSTCDRCGASWHAIEACPIDPNARPTAADAVAGGSCCSPPPAAGDE